MDCAVMNANSDGIHVGISSLVKGSQLVGNFGQGINLDFGGVAVGNTAVGNHLGIEAQSGSCVTDNTVYASSGIGINAAGYCTITRNTIHENTGTGISSGNYCTITNNTTDGLTLWGANCTMADNTVTP